MEPQKALDSHSNLEKEERSGRNHTTQYQTILLGHSNKTAWYGIKTDKWTNEQNGKPRIKVHLYGQLIFDKGGNNIHWTEDSLFSKWC